MRRLLGRRARPREVRRSPGMMSQAATEAPLGRVRERPELALAEHGLAENVRAGSSGQVAEVDVLRNPGPVEVEPARRIDRRHARVHRIWTLDPGGPHRVLRREVPGTTPGARGELEREPPIARGSPATIKPCAAPPPDPDHQRAPARAHGVAATQFGRRGSAQARPAARRIGRSVRTARLEVRPVPALVRRVRVVRMGLAVPRVCVVRMGLVVRRGRVVRVRPKAVVNVETARARAALVGPRVRVDPTPPIAHERDRRGPELPVRPPRLPAAVMAHRVDRDRGRVRASGIVRESGRRARPCPPTGELDRHRVPPKPRTRARGRERERRHRRCGVDPAAVPARPGAPVTPPPVIPEPQSSGSGAGSRPMPMVSSVSLRDVTRPRRSSGSTGPARPSSASATTTRSGCWAHCTAGIRRSVGCASSWG